ncbi:MAG: hypothetical protein K8J31_02425, partial [Anaerolineae bacterium]|nr:hypothetical protein [Anaerolineae bacterium]
MTDDDRDRDDEILDDDDEENEDDEQIGRFQNRRPPVKPFSSTGSNPGSSSSRPPSSGSPSPGSGRDSSQLPGNRPGGFQSRYGSSPTSGSGSSGSSTTPFSSSGLSRPGSSSTPSASRPAFTPPGGVIGGRRDSDEDDEAENRPSASAASSSASPARSGFGSFRSPSSGSERPPERRESPSSPPRSSGGASSSSASSPSGSSGGGPLGGFRSKLPGAASTERKDNKPTSASRSGGSSPLGGISQGLGGLRSKLPGSKGDQKPAASSSTSPASRSPFSSAPSSSPGLGSRSAPGSSAATAGKRDPKAASGGLLSRIPFLGKKEETRARPATTREKMERASKAPKIDERGLTLDNKLDILGVGLLLGSLALFFSSMSSTKGQLTEAVNTFLVQLLGIGAIAVPVIMFAIGIWLIIRHFGDEAPIVDPVRLVGIGLIYVGILLLFQFMESFNPEYSGINLRNLDELRLQLELSYMLGRGGGWLGAELYYLLVANIGEAGMVVSMAGLLLIGTMLTVRVSAAELAIFFISIWRSFVDAQRRRSQTREARARLRAAELAAAAESRVSVTRPAAAELPGGSSPALPAVASAEAGEEPRPIPITMGGRTVTAFFDGKETLPLEAGALAASEAEADSPSIAARLFSAVPGLGRSSTDKAPKPTQEPKSGGRFGGLLNRSTTAKPQPETSAT